MDDGCGCNRKVPNTSHRDFAKRLVALMEEKALSQGDLAELVGVSTATAWGWIHESMPQRRTAHVLCMKLNVSRDWLIYGKGERKPFAKGGGSDIALSFLEKFEQLDIISARSDVAAKVYKEIIADLRSLAASFEKRNMAAAAKSVRKLALSYESRSPFEASKPEISKLVKELARQFRGAQSHK